jgi:hypothetical protein
MELNSFWPQIQIEDGKVISLETWHKSNGEWLHIYADYKNKKFYTNGKLEE